MYAGVLSVMNSARFERSEAKSKEDDLIVSWSIKDSGDEDMLTISPRCEGLERRV